MAQREADVVQRARTEAAALLKDLRFGTVYAWRANARSAALLLGVTALAALFPVVQVVALARLTQLLQDGSSGSALLPVLVLVVIFVGANGPLITLRGAIEERSMLSTSVAMQVELVRRAAALPPSTIADAKTGAAIEGHSRAIIDAVSYLYGNLLTGVGAVLSAVGVLATLFWLSPVAAVLVLVGVLPSLLAGRYVSRAVGRKWQVLGAVYQRDRYLRDMMSRQRSMTELASLGSTERLARAVAVQQTKIESVRNIPITATIRAQIVVALAGILFLGGGVYYAVTQSSSGAVAVASVLAVMAAMTAASAGSVAFGELLQFIPQTTALRTFFAATRPADPVGPAGDRASVSQVEISGLRHVYAGSVAPAVAGVDAEVRRCEAVRFVRSALRASPQVVFVTCRGGCARSTVRADTVGIVGLYAIAMSLTIRMGQVGVRNPQMLLL